jgi:hypothetical protein
LTIQFTGYNLKTGIMETEIWRDIEEYKGFYQVSNLGRVRSLDRNVSCFKDRQGVVDGRILIPKKSRVGYLRVNLSVSSKVKTRNIHRLVANAFIPNPENKDQINHLDGDKTNNTTTNIIWSTCSENILHAYRELGKINPATGRSGSKNPESKPVLQYSLKGELIAEYPCIQWAADSIGCSYPYLSGILSGRLKYKPVKDFYFKFKNQDNGK